MDKKSTKCPFCDKTYTRASSLEKHTITCQYLNKSKKDKKIEEEETANLPTYKELVAIVQEFALKCAKMEEKMALMEKWVETKKKKINVVQWLNANVVPEINYSTWVKQLKITQQHIKYLFDNSIIDTVSFVFEENIKLSTSATSIAMPNPNNPIPIYSFNQKSNNFYIFDLGEWRELVFTDLAYLFKQLQNKLLLEMNQWRTENLEQINRSDKISELYNKNMIKLMNISFVQDATFSKMKTNMYNSLKVDIKHLIEFEFEF